MTIKSIHFWPFLFFLVCLSSYFDVCVRTELETLMDRGQWPKKFLDKGSS
jgi:hypothetical protein